MKFRALLLQQAALWAWTAAALTLIAGAAPERMGLSALAWFLAGHSIGYLLCLLGHPQRRFGWLTFGWTGLALMAMLAESASVTAWRFVVFGACHGLIDVPLSLAFEQSPRHEWPRFFWRLQTVNVIAAIGGWVLGNILFPEDAGAVVTSIRIGGALAAIIAAVSFWMLIRETIELMAAWLLLPAYRIRCRGPGCKLFPLYGPVIVIANHAAFFDPCWLGKVIPRCITPMMTSAFYDLPILHWLVKRVVRAIRVQESNYRYEIPELNEAISRLDEGECLVIFPEGNLRRDDSKQLRRFGQGIWHILRERPFTPVVPCWIEGNWGSFFSHWHGPPMRHKPPDFWRRITIMMAEPVLVPPEILAAHGPTRQYLMDAVLELRKLL